MQEAILVQKIEFLEMEIEETRKNQERLEASNLSLSHTLRGEIDCKDHIRNSNYSQLKDTNDKLKREIQELNEQCLDMEDSLSRKQKDLLDKNTQLKSQLTSNELAHTEEINSLLQRICELENNENVHRNNQIDSVLQEEKYKLNERVKELEKALLKYQKRREKKTERNNVIENFQKEKTSYLEQIESLKASIRQYQFEIDFKNENRTNKALKKEIKYLIKKIHQTESSRTRFNSTGRSSLNSVEQDSPLNCSLLSTISSKLSERYSSSLRSEVLNNYEA